MNNRFLVKSGVGKGYVENSFHIQMSRGYCNVTPVQRDDASKLHEYGPFYRNSPTCVYTGRQRMHYWQGRTVFFPITYMNAIAWFLNIFPKSFTDKISDFNKLFCALPSYVNSFTTLTKFSHFNEGFSGEVNYKLLNVDEHLKRLKLPKDIPMAVKDDIFNAKVTLGTHPGITTRKLADRVQSKGMSKVKKVTKTNLLCWVVNDLYNAWDKISEGKVGATVGTYCIGSREKIQTVELGEPVEARPLWIPEMPDVILGSTWLETLKEYWNRGTLYNSEIWLGHSDTKMRYYRRIELDVKFRYSYEFDGKVWDSSVVKELIVSAFNIYASCFEQNETVLNHFKFLCDTFVMKRLIMHNGNSFLLNHGIPSGHAWTAHINSMCNWILWTSTIHNCPHVPRAFRDDYELQIMGDDVCIHSNHFIDEDVRHEITKWMLFHFNYLAVDDTKQPEKGKVEKSDDASSFLKRYVDKNGNLATKSKDVWKKLIFGADYSDTRKSRLTYLLRRINDLAISDQEEVKRVAVFIAFTEAFERKFYNLPAGERMRKHKIVFQFLFYLSTAFTDKLQYTWLKFVQLMGIDVCAFNERVAFYTRYINQVYRQNYWTYDSQRQYVDYWAERKQSTTVSKALRNMEEYQIMSSVSIFEKLHGPYIKKGSKGFMRRNKNKRFK